MIGPTRKLDDATKIEAICIDLDIPFDAEFYILLHDFIKEYDPEGTLDPALFEQNKQYAEKIISNIKTGSLEDKLATYKEKILPKMREYDWYDAYKAFAKKEGTEETEEDEENLEDTCKAYDAAEKSRNTETDETEYLGDLMD